MGGMVQVRRSAEPGAGAAAGPGRARVAIRAAHAARTAMATVKPVTAGASAMRGMMVVAVSSADRASRAPSAPMPNRTVPSAVSARS
jgi:hypothetical protein